MLYRTDGPNEIVRVEGDYRSRAVDSADVVASDADDPRGDWQVMLSNPDVAVAISRRRQAMPYRYRDMVGDLLYFVHRGTGTFATEFGPIAYEPGDYIHLPKGTTFRHMPDDRDQILLVVESPGPIRPWPSTRMSAATRRSTRRCSKCPTSSITAGRRRRNTRCVCAMAQSRGAHSSIFYKNDPLKVVGWKGDLFPFKLNIRHILPIMSDRIHLAPSSWATFEAPGVAILSFVPQIAVSDLNAEELPSYHRNIDMDEVMLNHADEDPVGPPPRPLPPHPARHIARRRRGHPRRLPEEAPSPERSAPAGASASTPTARSSRARNSPRWRGDKPASIKRRG